MYLRTIRRHNQDGSCVEYYQLAHNTRHPESRQPVAQVIHSFGRADQLDRNELVRLCRSIARVCGLAVEDPVDNKEKATGAGEGLGLPEGMEQIRTVELGTVLVIEALWERLGFAKVLRAVGKAGKRRAAYERALLAMTANRLCKPESKLGVWDRWLQDEVYLSSCDGLKLGQMYEAMDLLYAHSAEVEQEVFFQTADLMNLDVTLVFYDTTTSSFSVDYEDEDDEEVGEGLRKRGHAKEGGWAPQVVVALAVTREGIPVRSWVFPGNTTDATTVQRVKADLKGWKLGRAMFVADSGTNSAENREELGKACGKYILAMRMGSVTEVKQEVLARSGRYKKVAENLQAKEVVVGDGERRRRYILCYNPKQAEREQRHRQQVLVELEEELGRHRDRKATAQWAVELLASGRYRKYVTVGKQGDIRIDRAAVQEAAKYDGKWVLLTNDDTISTEDAACGYKGLMVIERCFRSLKRTQIKMSPMYHWLPHRIVAHVKICVQALLIERVAELSCGQPWSRIRHELRRLQATEYETANFRFFRRNKATSAVVEILRKLQIPLPKPVLGVSAAG